MPSKNIVKHYQPNAFYHVYNEAANNRTVCVDDEDYGMLINILKRYASADSSIKVVAFCLNPQSMHLLLYQKGRYNMTDFMRKVGTSYVSYFNQKHSLEGKLFRTTYKATRMLNASQQKHVSRYIHRQADNYLQWEWSSLNSYVGGRRQEWTHPELLGLNLSDYRDFVKNDREFQASLRFLKPTFADSK